MPDHTDKVPLHQRVETPDDGVQMDAPLTGTDSKIEHHLVALERHLSTVEDRIEDVRTALEGDVPSSIAATDGGSSGETAVVAAGRLREALSNALIATHQVYALCVVLQRTETEH